MPAADYLLNLAPAALKQPYGAATLRAMGATKDGQLALTKLAVEQRFPSQAASDALDLKGNELTLPRIFGESDANYAARLQAADIAWTRAGTHYGVLLLFLIQGYTDIVIVQANGMQSYLDASRLVWVPGQPFPELVRQDTGRWDYDANPGGWNRFSVLFLNPLPAAWAGTPPGANTPEQLRILSIVRSQWKAAHAICVSIIIWQTGWLWGVPEVLNHPGLYDYQPQWGDGRTYGGTETVWVP